MKIFYSTVLLLISVSFCFSQGDSSRTIRSVPVASISGSQMISLTDICDAMGYRWQWDRYSQRFSCTRNTTRLSFVQDNRFYTMNDKVFQLPASAVRHGGTLYIPLQAASEIFGDSGETLKLNSEAGTVSTSAPRFSILSVLCDKKQNGTLLTINLTDSLPFDYIYYYPSLTLNFFGGTVDTQKVKQGRVGLVKSVSSVQFKESAQISVRLVSEIEEPVIDYVQDTKTLMVSLRPLKSVQNQKKRTPPPVESQAVKTIVLDPGHGGKDPGAIGSKGVKEKDIVLGIALYLRDLLERKTDLKVYMTRDKDVFVPLSERTRIANQKKADLFISIHADAVPGTDKRKEGTKGYKIYFLSQAKNEEDKLVAMRENAVIELEEKPQNYSSLQNVLIDLAGNEYLRESQDLCILLDQKFSASLQKKITKLHLGIGQANFWVLNGAYMPSVLIETGFLSNPKEEKLLADKNFQKSMAEAIFNAVTSFQSKYEGKL
jgi:N-acetylmuramoyl-L-alanine amidase